MRRERLFENIKGAFLHMGAVWRCFLLERPCIEKQAGINRCLPVFICLCGLFLYTGDFRQFVKADL